MKPAITQMKNSTYSWFCKADDNSQILTYATGGSKESRRTCTCVTIDSVYTGTTILTWGTETFIEI